MYLFRVFQIDLLHRNTSISSLLYKKRTKNKRFALIRRKYVSTVSIPRVQNASQANTFYISEDRDLVRSHIRLIEQSLAIKEMEDWYNISLKEVLPFFQNPNQFEQHYSNSLFKFLRSAYPDYNWLPWKFNEKLSKAYWKDLQNQRQYFDWLGQQLGVQKLEDWYLQSALTLTVTLLQ